MKVLLTTKNFVRILLIGLIISITIIVAIIIGMIYEKSHHPIITYLESKFHADTRRFVFDSLNMIPEVSSDKIALDLGASITQKDTAIPLAKGYYLIAYDARYIYYDLLIPESHKYKNQYRIIDEIDWDNLPNPNYG